LTASRKFPRISTLQSKYSKDLRNQLPKIIHKLEKNEARIERFPTLDGRSMEQEEIIETLLFNGQPPI
jgi:hypothetical protein